MAEKVLAVVLIAAQLHHNLNLLTKPIEFPLRDRLG
jgi:hypothetical protein